MPVRPPLPLPHRSPLRPLLVALVAVLAVLLGGSPARAAAGVLRVANDRAEPVLVQVDRDLLGEVAAHGRRDLPLRPGLHEVTLRSRSGALLQRDTTRIQPGAVATVRLAALEAPVRVVNPLDRPVRLLVDGRDFGPLPAWSSRTVALLPGRHSLTLALVDRTVVTEGLLVPADARPLTWAPRPAMLGEVVVDNPLPIPVSLTCSRGLVRVVPAYGRTRYEGLGEGPFDLVLRRADGGERLGELRATVRAFDTVQVHVPEPRSGILALESNRRHELFRVIVDGRHLADLAPGRSLRLELGLGAHEVVLRSQDGREQQRHPVWIDRYEPVQVALAPRDHHERPDADGTAHHGHGHDRDGYERDGHEPVASASCAMR